MSEGRRLVTILVLFLGFSGSAAAVVDTEHTNIVFPMSVKEMRTSCQQALKQGKTAFDQVAKLPAEKRTWDTTFGAIDRAYLEVQDAIGPLHLMAFVHRSKAVRDEGLICRENSDNFDSVQFARRDVFSSLSDVAEKIDKSTLSQDAQREMDLWMLIFKKGGAQLSKNENARLVAIRKELAAIETTFRQNLSEAISVKDGRGYVVAEERELEGVAPGFLGNLGRAKDGRFILPMLDPIYLYLMRNGKNADLRSKIERIYENRGTLYLKYDNGWTETPVKSSNTDLLRRTLVLRKEEAKLLGYETYTHFQTAYRMAGTPEVATSFLSEVRSHLAPLCEDELASLRALKSKEEGGDDTILSRDWFYYSTLYKKLNFQVDVQKVREYFPVEKVTKGIFRTYEKMLGLRFERVADAKAWDPEIELYRVWDAASNELLGYYYLDSYAFDGKRSGAFQSPIYTGIRRNGKLERIPVSGLTTNFMKAAPGSPALMDHGDVWTYFHEFGHVMHFLLSQHEHVFTSGHNSFGHQYWDFIEVPSQMLENWAWNPFILNELSGHYETGAPLPKELRKQMLAARNSMVGCTGMRQVFFATVDLAYHLDPNPEKLDTTAVWSRMQKEIQLLPLAEGNHKEGTFSHFFGGYGSAYYGYQWSLRFSSDLFTRFENEGLRNPETGMDYRTMILEPGGLYPPMELIRNFLGREPNDRAYYRMNYGVEIE